ncbi:MAG: hypothetical protein DRR16_32050 [Candidatus Parabeggiatoa sp. nov. 3]|nr:MAG: hypothetical protein DRR00_31175 [Gammaproteobacteria bacterium]RKZ55373.1 MAG: hypothetical protein DRQ99_30105 [Gammaproteobacteria bacterium]RKZ74562.1 MAG: hypothetical protein DRR16_32050 [Gammaproteobacteria bacterium]HEW98951.1 hypothetical protein [Beggiatoa sp.]
MEAQFALNPIESFKESKLIQFRRNGDGKLTQIQAYKGLFCGLKKQFNRENDWFSFFLLYDLKSGFYWWDGLFHSYDDVYAKRNIDTRLSELGYWEEENGVYVYYNNIRQLNKFTFFSAKRIVDFESFYGYLSIGEFQERYDIFENAYNQFMLRITAFFDRKGSTHNRYKNIFLLDYIDRTFFRDVRTYGGSRSKLIEVIQEDSQWQIELEGNDRLYGDKTRVRVVLNENYELVDLFGELFIKQKTPLYLAINKERYERQEILDLMNQGIERVQEIASFLNKDNQLVSQLLQKMLKSGKIEKVEYGQYKALVKRADTAKK